MFEGSIFEGWSLIVYIISATIGFVLPLIIDIKVKKYLSVGAFLAYVVGSTIPIVNIIWAILAIAYAAENGDEFYLYKKKK